MEAPEECMARSQIAVKGRADLVLAFSKVLYVNGQATEQTVNAAERFSRALGLRAIIVPHWGGLQLVADGKDGALIAEVAARPAGVEMDRVASAMKAIENIELDDLDVAAVTDTIDKFRGRRRHQRGFLRWRPRWAPWRWQSSLASSAWRPWG